MSGAEPEIPPNVRDGGDPLDPFATRTGRDEESANEARWFWGQALMYSSLPLIFAPPLWSVMHIADLSSVPEWARDDAAKLLYVLGARAVVVSATMGTGVALLYAGRALILPIRATIDLARARRGPGSDDESLLDALLERLKKATPGG